MSAWPKREREDVVAVADGGGGAGGGGAVRGKGERGILNEVERERGVWWGAEAESVGDSCRGVAGSISVDRRHKLFQWTQSSGSIVGPFLLSNVSLSLSLFILLSLRFSSLVPRTKCTITLLSYSEPF